MCAKCEVRTRKRRFHALRMALLLELESRQISKRSRMNEISLLEPQRMMGISGVLVSNDRAVKWVKAE